MKRSLSFLLTFCLVMSLFVGVMAPSAGAVTYKDVEKNFWAYNEIYYLTDKNILQGDGTGNFRPKDNVTHIEFIKMIVAAFNLTDATFVNFTNVPQWAKEGRYLEKAEAQGFLLDEYTSSFDFTKDLTREEAVALIMRYLDLDEDLAVSASRYPDYDKITPAYRSYALIATGAGIVQGDDTGYFQPSRVLTRSEALRILYTAAGAIYDKSANRAETGAYKTNATINRSVNLANITFSGNVYVTEGVASVNFNDCTITGDLIIRGSADVTLDDSVVANITINGDKAELELDGDTLVSNVTANAKSTIDVDEDAQIRRLVYNSGAKASSLTGKGEVTNITVAADGITSEGVAIGEYTINRGYTATFDGIKYEAGTGKPAANNIARATVNGANNVITINATATAEGTLYMAAWPRTLSALSAADIKSAATSIAKANGVCGTYKSVKANVATTMTLTVTGAAENYNVGLIFLPNNTVSATNVKPYYNKDVLTTSNENMVNTAPEKVASLAPTWTLTTSGNSLVLTFDQPIYLKDSNSLKTLSSMTAANLEKLFAIQEGKTSYTTIRNFSVAVYYSATSTTITLTPATGVTNGNTYIVTISSSIVNDKYVAVSKTAASVTAGASTKVDAPTLTCSSPTSSVTTADYVSIGVPTGTTKVRYTVTVDGREAENSIAYSFTSTANYVYFRDYPTASVVTITAFAIDDDNRQISETATGNYYLGIVPLITVNGTEYFGTGNTATTSSTATVSTSAVPAGYTATYSINGTTVAASDMNTVFMVNTSYMSYTFSMTLRPTSSYYYGTSSVTTTVTVTYASGTGTGGGSSYNPYGSLPNPKVQVLNKDGGVAFDYSEPANRDYSDAKTLKIVPNATTGIAYKYKVSTGSSYYSGVEADLPSAGTTVSMDGVHSYVITVTAYKDSTEVQSWTYTFNAR